MDLAQRARHRLPAADGDRELVGLQLLPPRDGLRDAQVELGVPGEQALDERVVVQAAHGGDERDPAPVDRRAQAGVGAAVVAELVPEHRAHLVHGERLEQRQPDEHAPPRRPQPQQAGVLGHGRVHLRDQADLVRGRGAYAL
ncbi:hypothetical protein GCM10020220_086040 [Nonomuraea rubra]